MTLFDYFRLLRRRWWLLAVCVVLGGLGAYAATQAQTRVYASSLTFNLANGQGLPVSTLVTEAAQSRFQSYATLVQSRPVQTQVLQTAGIQPSIFSASAAGVPGTIFMRLSVQSDSPQHALALGEAYAKVLPAFVTNFEGVGAQSDGTTLAVFEKPTAGSDPISPDVRRNLLAGLALGLVLGVAAVLVLNSVDTRLRTSADLEDATGLSALATVPLEHRGRSLVVQSHPRSLRAEAVRQIRANLQFAALDTPLQVLVVTSAVPGEGKTSVAADLALACAEAGQVVVLVDADLRKPRVAEVFDRPTSPGLTDVLVGNADLETCLTAYDGAALHVLTSGTLPARPSELLGSQAMGELIDRLVEQADLVLVDSAPLLPVADTAALLAHADAVLLVSRLESTTRKQVGSAVERLRSFQTRIVGVVANEGRSAGADGYYLASMSRLPWRRRAAEPMLPPTEVAPGVPFRRPSRDAASEAADVRDAS